MDNDLRTAWLIAREIARHAKKYYESKVLEAQAAAERWRGEPVSLELVKQEIDALDHGNGSKSPRSPDAQAQAGLDNLLHASANEDTIRGSRKRGRPRKAES